MCLNLNRNRLRSAIPDGLYALTKLRDLRLSNNALTGYLVEDVSRLCALRVLHVQKNKLKWTVPPTLAACTSLRSLDLSDNGFRNALPSSLSNLRLLEEFRIHGNSRIDTLDVASLGALGNLEELNVSRLDATADGDCRDEMERALVAALPSTSVVV